MTSEDKYPRDREGEEILPPRRDNPPFKENLTVIWEHEKQALHARLDAQALTIEQLASRVKTLESWALQLRREPMFKDNPLHQVPEALKEKLEKKATATVFTTEPGPQRINPPRIPEVDYEGPREGPHR